MKRDNCKKVRLYNRRGDELIEDSIKQAVKDLGISRTTLRNRNRDGYCVHIPNVARGIYIQVLE